MPFCRKLYIRANGPSISVQSVRIYRFGGLDRWRHGRSRGSPARLAGRTCLDRLVDLDDRAQPVAAGTDHRGAVAMQHRPRGLLGADPEYTLQPESGDPCFWLVICHTVANHTVNG